MIPSRKLVVDTTRTPLLPWRPISRVPDLERDLHVWSIDLTLDPPEEHRSDLPPSILARAARFRFPLDRRRYLTSHSALRQILSAYVGKVARREFELSELGKPSLPGNPVQFNLSHAGDLAMVAVHHELPVGIDVERVQRTSDLPELAQRYFAPEECREVLSLSPDAMPLGFYRCWTRKEAIIKATGEGLSRPLNSFAVSIEAEPDVRLRRIDRGEPGCWTLHEVLSGTDYVAAVAVTGSVASVHRWHYDAAGM